ncbi:DNA ligase [Shewanella sp. AS1]|uniref:DNA ligase n=1 Tax=Shewanella sp. AS1 TaxID=2907626 RepID=UPI001F2027BF|nr:DNA ligase [Shewanella sp. AS1]MCE9678351.1 DNA ligase [Shewanella sp. AS1]
MSIYLRRFISLILFGFIYFSLSAFSDVPDSSPMQHAGALSPSKSIVDYLVSEKLDGVRGRWDGGRMLTRSGNEITLPSWFAQGFPKQALDGELWIGRGQFDAISALVRRGETDDHLWRQVRFMVFDIPNLALPFAERYHYALEHFSTLSPYLVIIPQWELHDRQELDRLLDSVVIAGGEGLMLHRKAALYRNGRNQDLVKLKLFEDAEALVIAHHPGKGKYQGMLGSLEVKTPEGIVFRIGTGFSDEQRKAPPAIGTTVTYKFYGVTQYGIPRFASFVRIREPL